MKDKFKSLSVPTTTALVHNLSSIHGTNNRTERDRERERWSLSVTRLLSHSLSYTLSPTHLLSLILPYFPLHSHTLSRSHTISHTLTLSSTPSHSHSHSSSPGGYSNSVNSGRYAVAVLHEVLMIKHYQQLCSDIEKAAVHLGEKKEKIEEEKKQQINNQGLFVVGVLFAVVGFSLQYNAI